MGVVIGFLATLVATFSGVVLAFSLNRWWERRKRNEEKNNILKELKTELTHILIGING